ncbi:MAG: hypothetical protein IKN73_01635 [Alphaproteobacteria bacterium]|nr:hypothetical protein [Alphaproteobacteria bacterium]
MKKIYNILFNVSVFALMPAIAGAAGTYYNGSLYQSSRYNNQGYYNKYGAGRSYPTRNVQQQSVQNNSRQQRNVKKSGSVKQGFVLDAGLSHEMANWKFEMDKAGSKLQYDNLAWNVISGQGTYYFNTSTPVQIKVGARYGMQYGETSMIDDDITNGGYISKNWVDENNNVFAQQTGHAISVGKSSDGNQFGFNAEFGLTDAFNIGGVKITPAVGYRYLKYKLSTKQNYGTTIDILESSDIINCLEVQDGEIQCSPFLVFANSSGNITGFGGFAVDTDGSLVVDSEGNFVIEVPGGTTRVDVGETYYYEQSGKSHSYETTWMGPYVALNMEYMVNSDNFIDAGVEFGLPMYDSKGNQPYRYDWEHPTSVEDKGDFGDAYHLGLNAIWTSMVSDSVGLSLGFTYDYYKVSDATAKTYLNKSYYESELNRLETAIRDAENKGETVIDEAYQSLEDLYALKSKGWTQEDKKEISSVYKAMGIRAGVSIKF